MANSGRITRLLLGGVAVALALAAPALAAQGSPLDDYYRRQAETGAAPVDNDQYYYAPGQYIDKYYHAPGTYTPPARSTYQSCDTIGDSPACLGD